MAQAVFQQLVKQKHMEAYFDRIEVCVAQMGSVRSAAHPEPCSDLFVYFDDDRSRVVPELIT